LLRLLSGHVLVDAEGHLAVLQRSGLVWTVGVNASTRISRDDLADFIVKSPTMPSSTDSPSSVTSTEARLALVGRAVEEIVVRTSER